MGKRINSIDSKEGPFAIAKKKYHTHEHATNVEGSREEGEKNAQTPRSISNAVCLHSLVGS